MYKFKKEIIIDRAQQEVFDFATNPTNDPKWRGISDFAEWTSPSPVGVGSIQRSEGSFLGRKIDSTSEVTAWDPPNQFGLKTVSGPVPFEINVNMTSNGNGTNIILNGQAEFGGFFKLAEGLAGKQLEKQIDKDFETLKKLMENGA